MKKAAILAFVLAALFGACVPVRTTPPATAFYVEDLPQSVTMLMSLDERLAAEGAWKDIRAGNPYRAQKGLARLGPESVVFHAGKGYVFLDAGKTEFALTSFQEALKINPDFLPAWVGLVQVHEFLGNENDAFSKYREILKREPGHSWAKPRFDSLRKKKTSESMDEAKRALAAKDVEGAKKACFTALFFSPESVEAHIILARIYRQQKDSSNAVLHYKATTIADPKNKSALREYADTLYEEKDFGPSMELYERLAELDPNDKTVRSRIESLKNRLGIYEIPSLYATIPNMESVTREDVAALIAVKFKGILNDSGVKPPILVDIATSWAANFILKTTALGIMEHYENHTFLPKKIVNRAEIAETLVRLIDYLKTRGFRLKPQMPPESIRISDVPPDHHYNGPIAVILAYQIMELTPQKTFQPDAVVGGKEAIRMLDILLELAK